MTAALEPTSPAIAGAETDHLGAAVLRSLNRNYKNKFSVSFVRALGSSLISFGVLPVFGLGRRFSDYAMFDRQHLWHLSEWLRLQTGREEATVLRDLTRTIRFRDALQSVAVLLALGAVGVLLWQVWGTPHIVSALVTQTWGVHPWRANTGALPKAFIVWNAALFGAYMIQFIQVKAYRRGIERFVEQFNKLALAERLPPVAPPAIARGPALAWVATGVILTLMGAIWGIPLALAGLAQRRFINVSAARTRSEMADRVRVILTRSRPVLRHLEVNVHGPVCLNYLCRAKLPAAATFCPRCGVRLEPAHRVA